MAISRFKKGVPGFGFDAFGYPLKYDTASEAGCGILRIPQDGLVFYAPLDKEASTAVTGQSLSKSGTVTYETVDGVPMCRFNNGYIYVQNGGDVPSGNASRTVSCYAYMLEPTGTYPGIVYCGDVNKSNCLTIIATPESIIATQAWRSGSRVGSAENSEEAEKMQHLAVTYSSDGNILTTYCNGVKTGDAVCSGGINTSNKLYIGILADNDMSRVFPGVICAVRIYNRVLSDKEIRALSKEFKI